jgi:hypothetical protein
MAKRTKKSSDPNVTAFAGMQSLLEKLDPESIPKPKEKSAAAVKRGKKGGVKGGKTRAANLTAEQRSKIARKAALARWKKARPV